MKGSCLAVSVGLLLGLGTGCGEEKWPSLDQRAVAAADAFIRAYYVKRDCQAVNRLAQESGSCEELRAEWRGEGFRFVPGTRRLVRRCPQRSPFYWGPKDVDCVELLIVSRDSLFGSGVTRRNKWVYNSGIQSLWLKEIDGRWKVVDGVFVTSGVCGGLGCLREKKLWRRAVVPEPATL